MLSGLSPLSPWLSREELRAAEAAGQGAARLRGHNERRAHGEGHQSLPACEVFRGGHPPQACTCLRM